MNDQDIGPPAHWHSLLEARVAAEAAMLMAQMPLLRLQLPRGTGPIMVLPGFMTDDTSTWLLRRFLSSLGYSVSPWGMGVNRGRMLAYLGPLIERLDEIKLQSQALPSLVGWSRGGTLAREIARERPDLVRQVITMGSPVRGGVQGTSIGRMVSQQTGLTPAQINQMLQERQRREIVTPITAIYSKTDGVVSWQACVDELNPNVTHRVVESSHMGFGFNSAVYRIVARTLASLHN